MEYKFRSNNNTKIVLGFRDEIIDEVNRDESDIAFGSLWHSGYLPQNISFTYPPHNQCWVTFLVPKPKLLPDASYVFQPLSFNLWCLTISAVVATSACISFLKYLEQKKFALRVQNARALFHQ